MIAIETVKLIEDKKQSKRKSERNQKS